MPNPKYKNLSKKDKQFLQAQDLGALVGFLGSRELENKKAKEKIGEGYPTAAKYKSGGRMRVKKSCGCESYKKGGTLKDACYSKVKSRYKVWPSAYASGALAKCRKVGVNNWGNNGGKKN